MMSNDIPKYKIPPTISKATSKRRGSLMAQSLDEALAQQSQGNSASFFSKCKFTGFAYSSSEPTAANLVDLDIPETAPDVLIVSPTTEAYVEFDDNPIQEPQTQIGSELTNVGTPTILANTFFTVPLRPKKITVLGLQSGGQFKIFAFWS